MIKAKDWNGEQLDGIWTFTTKLDGVRVIITKGVAKSRHDKPLYNVPYTLPDGDYECYLGTFKESVSRIRTHNGPIIDETNFYSLIDPIDDRLFPMHGDNNEIDHPGPEFIKFLLANVLKRGAEGLILRQGDKWLKVKPTITYDLVVTGYQPGTGKHTGRMGALITDMCKVGTGFKDVERDKFTAEYIVGKIIEVKGMGVTEAGKLRHPRFVRLRLDKS